MSTEQADSLQQALIFLMRAASKNGVNLTALVKSTEDAISEDTSEPYRSRITKQIRIAHAMAAGSLTDPAD